MCIRDSSITRGTFYLHFSSMMEVRQTLEVDRLRELESALRAFHEDPLNERLLPRTFPYFEWLKRDLPFYRRCSLNDDSAPVSYTHLEEKRKSALNDAIQQDEQQLAACRKQLAALEKQGDALARQQSQITDLRKEQTLLSQEQERLCQVMKERQELAEKEQQLHQAKDTCEQLETAFASQKEEPVSYTHLDVYKRQVYTKEEWW